MRSLFTILLTLFLLNGSSYAQQSDKDIQKGNEFYKQKQYDKAEQAYNDALKKEPSNTTARINKSNTLYRANRTTDAIKVLDELAEGNNDKSIKERSYYNKGAILSNQKRLEESIEAYKAALRQDPGDNEARENLQKALIELKKKTPPPKKEDKKQQQNKQQQQPKMNQKEAEQRLKLLEQKEKDVQQRLQKEKSKQGGGQPKDW